MCRCQIREVRLYISVHACVCGMLALAVESYIVAHCRLQYARTIGCGYYNWLDSSQKGCHFEHLPINTSEPHYASRYIFLAEVQQDSHLKYAQL